MKEYLPEEKVTEINISEKTSNENISKVTVCRNCGSNEIEVFFSVKNVPVHSVLLVYSKQEAFDFPRGNIELGFCHKCGFISNLAFEPEKLNYSSNYEETQGFSDTFNLFHRNLAQKLIAKYELFSKDIIEIGCGKGEFLSMLCEIGNNRGIGFDPAYISERNNSPAKDRIMFIEDFYSEKYSHYKADFICCKMTLEHIPDTFEFVSMVRRAIGDNLKTTVFFQIPDVRKVLKNLGFWDIYYEHCSYFSPVSLKNLFIKAGFNILDIYNVYEDQYLVIEARPVENASLSSPLQPVEDVKEIYRLVSYFSSEIRKRFQRWMEKIKSLNSSGKKIVLWGGGSKAVSFLTTLGIKDEIKYAVDINPFKHGKFIAGTGQEVVSPEFLKEYKPDIVFLMNSIYFDEVQSRLKSMDLHPEIIPMAGEPENKEN